MDNVTLRDYVDGDEIKIVDFLKQMFKHWPRPNESLSDIDFWKWKYIDIPSKVRLITVAESENEIVGCLHRAFVKMKLYDESKLGFVGGDVAVHPDFRGRGIWKNIVKRTSEKSRKRARASFLL